MLIDMAVVFLPYLILMAILIGMVMTVMRCARPRIGIQIMMCKGGQMDDSCPHALWFHNVLASIGRARRWVYSVGDP